jgi:phosphatidylinositol glycan class U
MLGLLAISYSMLHSWNFLRESYGFILYVTDLSPNIGLFWYFFTEVFAHFQVIFHLTIEIHLRLIIIGSFHVCISISCLYLCHSYVHTVEVWWSLFPMMNRSFPLFRDHEMLTLWLQLNIIATFKSYPCVGDIALQLAIFPLVYDKMKGKILHPIHNIDYNTLESIYCFLIPIVSIFCTVLAPIFWHMWIYSGTGNANFYYASKITIISHLFHNFISNSKFGCRSFSSIDDDRCHFYCFEERLFGQKIQKQQKIRDWREEEPISDEMRKYLCMLIEIFH